MEAAGLMKQNSYPSSPSSSSSTSPSASTGGSAQGPGLGSGQAQGPGLANNTIDNKTTTSNNTTTFAAGDGVSAEPFEEGIVMEALMRAYEKEMKTPIQGLLLGNLMTAMLIQMQKLKVQCLPMESLTSTNSIQ